MKYISLVSNSRPASRIAFGCAALGGYDYGPVNDERSIQALRRAVDLGVSLFDTADVYGLGRSEEVLRKAFGEKLKDLIIATKFGVDWDANGRTRKDISPDRIEGALAGSLRRLGLDVIPLYQIHWPDGKTLLEDCVAKLESLKKKGMIASYGVCNVSAEELDACYVKGGVETVQVPFSLAEQENDSLLAYARTKYNTATIIYNALAHGLFTGKYDRSSQFSGTDLRTRVKLFRGAEFERALHILGGIKVVAAARRVSCTQVALAWLLKHSSVSIVIVGAKTPEQIADSCSSCDFELTPEEYRLLNDHALWTL